MAATIVCRTSSRSVDMSPSDVAGDCPQTRPGTVPCRVRKGQDWGMARLVDPELEQILAFCAEEPVERVFLEDVARRGLGRFTGLAEDGNLVGLCHVGANLVPSGRGCAAFADAARRGRARMIIGE